MAFKLVVIFAFVSLFLYHRRQLKNMEEEICRLDRWVNKLIFRDLH